MANPKVGTPENPLRVAVVGSGPSAFYAVDALFKVEGLHVRCDVFDRLPTPYGLVRGGVAPDHQKIKNVIRIYEKIATHDGFRFFGHVKLGRDIQVDDLTAHYDQIVYGVGNEASRDLGIPGEDLRGVTSATEFVFWYNGHPDYRHLEFDLAACKRVAVVGNGNVAMDVCRVLIQDPSRLAKTDIAGYALDALRKSNIEDVLLLGRRGPAQAAFSPKEIQEIAELEDVDLVVDPAAVEVGDVTAKWLEEGAPKSAKKNLGFLTKAAANGAGTHRKKVRACFLVSPIELTGTGGQLTGVRLQHSELYAADDGTPRPRGLDQHSEREVQMVFKAIGYRGIEIPGVPFHQKWGMIPNEDGRVTTEAGASVRNQYVVGWCKRGPTGLIGTNSPDSKATVAKMIEDVPSLVGDERVASDAQRIVDLLDERGITYVTYADWKKLDALEVANGEKTGRVRLKFTEVDAMLAAIHTGGGG